jgi:hypothetical protein
VLAGPQFARLFQLRLAPRVLDVEIGMPVMHQRLLHRVGEVRHPLQEPAAIGIARRRREPRFRMTFRQEQRDGG